MPGKQTEPENMEARKRSYVFSSQVTEASAGHEVAPDPVPEQPAAPDPRASSLDKLGIEPYTPYSGHSAAQTYIRDGYAKLCRMEGITDWLEYSMKFYFQEIGDEKTLEWNTFPVSSAFWEYSRVFAPHLDQYMADLGFYDAAIELLMPVSGTWRDSADLDSDDMRQYFADLANALEFEGIEFNGQTVVSREVIEKALRKRMAEVWMCEGSCSPMILT